VGKEEPEKEGEGSSGGEVEVKIWESKFYNEIEEIYSKVRGKYIEFDITADILAIDRDEYDSLFTPVHVIEYKIVPVGSNIIIVLAKKISKDGDVDYVGYIDREICSCECGSE